MSAVTTTDAKPRLSITDRAISHRVLKFIHAYTDSTGETYHNGTKAAIAAGYSNKCAGQQATVLLKRLHVQSAITAADKRNAARL
ncbi:MAG: terminase small subunit, partial [Chloroflexi bacterium]|nr:terminase small subunit [Chloroflexota bacterium]